MLLRNVPGFSWQISKEVSFCRENNDGSKTRIVLSATNFQEVPLKRCLHFLYTGIVELTKDSEMLDETVRVARILNLPELQLICENARKGDEILNPSIGTWLNDRNGSVAKKQFLNKSLFSDVTFSVQGEILPAHKLVLCCRCDFMSAMLSGRFLEGVSKEVNIRTHGIMYIHNSMMHQ